MSPDSVSELTTCLSCPRPASSVQTNQMHAAARTHACMHTHPHAHTPTHMHTNTLSHLCFKSTFLLINTSLNTCLRWPAQLHSQSCLHKWPIYPRLSATTKQTSTQTHICNIQTHLHAYTHVTYKHTYMHIHTHIIMYIWEGIPCAGMRFRTRHPGSTADNTSFSTWLQYTADVLTKQFIAVRAPAPLR